MHRLSVADLQAHPLPRDKGRQSGTEARPSTHAGSCPVAGSAHCPPVQPHAYPYPEGPASPCPHRTPHAARTPGQPRPAHPHLRTALPGAAPLSMVPPALPFPAAPGTHPPNGVGEEEEAVGSAGSAALCCGNHRDALGRTCRWEWGQWGLQLGRTGGHWGTGSGLGPSPRVPPGLRMRCPCRLPALCEAPVSGHGDRWC